MTDARRSVIRLAEHAPERERLTITANLLIEDCEPHALAVAESLARKFPDDPRAFTTLASARHQRGDWSGAAAAAERAIAMDSVAESAEDPNCILCRDYWLLGDIYLWADSLPAAERTARRSREARSRLVNSWYLSSIVAARRGDSAASYAAFRRLGSEGDNRHLKLRLDITLDAYENLERDVRPMLSTSVPSEFSTASWAYLIALRNQGRLREAAIFHRTGALPGFSTLGSPTNARRDQRRGVGHRARRAASAPRCSRSKFAPTCRDGRQATRHDCVPGTQLSREWRWRPRGIRYGCAFWPTAPNDGGAEARMDAIDWRFTTCAAWDSLRRGVTRMRRANSQPRFFRRASASRG